MNKIFFLAVLIPGILVAQSEKKQETKRFLSPSSTEAEIVEIPEMNFIMIDGKGNPGSSGEFQNAMGALYSVYFTLMPLARKEKPKIKFTFQPSEGLYWFDDNSEFQIEKMEGLNWTLMMMVPDEITKELLEKAVEQVKTKKQNPALSKVRLDKLNEGKSAQIMHIGPYSAEGPTIEKLHETIKKKGFILRGKHHEIYLGNPQTTAPEKLKTIIRQPFKEKEKD